MRLIDADALYIRNVSADYYYDVQGVTEDDIDNAPTVDAVEVVHAKWTKGSIDSDYPYQCTHCGAWHRALYNYCPTCGAHMDAEEIDNTRPFYANEWI